MNDKDYPVRVNTSTTITGSSAPNVNIYVTNALAGFTANGQTTTLVSGQALNFTSPYLVTGNITNATAGSIFYYYA